MNADANAAPLASDIAEALASNPAAKAAFDKMPPSHRKRWIDHVDEAKKPETRSSRIAKMVAQLETSP